MSAANDLVPILWGLSASINAQPAYYFRREFAASNSIVRVRLYASALGIDAFRINGTRVGTDMLAPGSTMYSKRVESLTYDGTDLIREGDNAIGAVVGQRDPQTLELGNHQFTIEM